MLAHGGKQKKILDNHTQPAPEDKCIIQQPIFHFSRLHPARFWANLLFFRHLLKLKPTLVIVATFELLPAAVLYKIWKKVPLIYDVQENYYRNIAYTSVFPPLIRHVLAFGLRAIERLAHPFINHYLLAEDCYLEEMPYLRPKSTVIANKFLKKAIQDISNKKPGFCFLYCGTISAEYGVFRALKFIQNFRKVCPETQLKIVGFCPRKADWLLLKKHTDHLDFVEIQGGEQIIPHDLVLEAMQQADFLLMPYYLNKSVAQRIPTKLYEALALKMPMLIQPNAYWQKYLDQYSFQAALWVDFDNWNNLQDIYQQLQTRSFYQNNPEIQGIYWEEEGEKLYEVLKKYLN